MNLLFKQNELANYRLLSRNDLPNLQNVELLVYCVSQPVIGCVPNMLIVEVGDNCLRKERSGDRTNQQESDRNFHI